MAFFVIGRDADGKREWARGTAMVSARRAAEKEKWKIESLSLTSLESTVSSADLFSEVGVPAGVGATLPAYGSPGNTGYVWRGAAAGDLDNDGLVDLFVTGAAGNHVYHNDGRGKFKDVATEVNARTTLTAGSQPLILDYDNDGDKDVFISAVGPQIMLENRLVPDGKLGFVDVTSEAGGLSGGWAWGGGFIDFDNDGREDLFTPNGFISGKSMKDT